MYWTTRAPTPAQGGLCAKEPGTHVSVIMRRMHLMTCDERESTPLIVGLTSCAQACSDDGEHTFGWLPPRPTVSLARSHMVASSCQHRKRDHRVGRLTGSNGVASRSRSASSRTIELGVDSMARTISSRQCADTAGFAPQQLLRGCAATPGGGAPLSASRRHPSRQRTPAALPAPVSALFGSFRKLSSSLNERCPRTLL